LGSEYLAHAVMAIHDCYRTGIHDPFGLSHRTHDARADSIHIPAQTHNTMGLMPLQIGSYQAVSNQQGV
jgi:hypothetical protein